MGANVAVDSLSLLFEALAPATLLPVAGVTLITPSPNVKAGGSFVLTDGLTVLIAPGGILSGVPSFEAPNVAPMSFTFSANKIKKTKANGNLLLGEGDESDTVTGGAFVNSSTGATADHPIALKISAAGQSSVKAG